MDAAAAAARLRIVVPAAAAPRGALQGALERLRRLCAPRHPAPLRLRLRIDDLQGGRVLELDDAGPLLELPLPAGTYHVHSRRGAVQRDYTMVLEPGRPFTLEL
ncbi:MAG: hypothetical protein KGI90_13255 [Burkholderiales bacterium]|nr:hypothetical protein [Burkholderiales bacterium]